MDEAQAIVFEAMERAGVTLPPGVKGFHDVETAGLISIVSQSIALASGNSEVYMPGFVPQSAGERVRVCTRLVESMLELGYRDDLSFHQFLYPNETEVHKLLRFLVEKLSKSPSVSTPRSKSRRRLGLMASQKDGRKTLFPEPETPSATVNGPSPATTDEIRLLEVRLAELKDQISEPENAEKSEDDLLLEEMARTKIVEQRLSGLRKFLGNGETPESALQRLERSVLEGEVSLSSSRQEWETTRKYLEEQVALKRGDQKVKVDEADEREIEELKSNLRAREEEKAVLESELERQPRDAPRRSSYVRRITELVKNSKKQEADVAKIIDETRALQRESNATQDRLHRVHAMVDELVFREARKEAASRVTSCRVAYRLLSRIHSGFADLAEKVMELDRLDREVSELEAETGRDDVDIAKVEADLEAIRIENAERALRSSM